MLEYLLIACLVAIALFSTFAYWGRTLRMVLSHVAWNSSAALQEEIK